MAEGDASHGTMCHTAPLQDTVGWPAPRRSFVLAQPWLRVAREDFTKNGKQYDLILDVVAHRSVFAYKRALRPNGSYFLTGGSVATISQILLLGPWIRGTTGKKIRILAVRPNLEDVLHITELCEAGKVTPAIDKTYPLSEVPEALRYLGEGRTKGKVVITV